MNRFDSEVGAAVNRRDGDMQNYKVPVKQALSAVDCPKEKAHRIVAALFEIESAISGVYVLAERVSSGTSTPVDPHNPQLGSVGPDSLAGVLDWAPDFSDDLRCRLREVTCRLETLLF